MVNDTHYVKQKELMKFVDEYVERHQKRFPKRAVNPNAESGDKLQPYGALMYLADQMSQANGLKFKSNYERIQRLRKGEGKDVSLYIADEILTAMGDIHLLGTEIKVYERKQPVRGSRGRFKVQTA